MDARDSAAAPTAIGEMLREAMRRKSAALGSRYTFRDLEHDSGVNFAYAARVANGERQPSRQMVRALARALAPHLPLDEAMVAAGFVEPDKQSALARLAAMPKDVLEEAERWARRRLLRGVPPKEEAGNEPQDSREGHGSEHEPNL